MISMPSVSPLKGFPFPREVISYAVWVTDKLKSYAVALRDDCPSADHRAHKGLNNRAEASHRHTRRRDKVMGRFKTPSKAISTHSETPPFNGA
jgi:transposase-like protein